MKITSLLTLSVLCALTQTQAASFTLDKTPTGGVIVKVDGEFLTELVVDQANKTYLWPIIGTSGVTLTRAYPMQTVEGEQHDHPHHRGLCFGHEDIAGYDTWAEAATFPVGDKNAKRLDHLGAIKLRQITEMKGGETATITTLSDYVDAGGKKTSEETRKYTFAIKGATRLIDVDIDLIATEADIIIEDKKDAGLSIRVPTEMAVDRGKELGKGTGHIISSEGLTDEAAWGKRATWVDYHGVVSGKAVGVAMLNYFDAKFWGVVVMGGAVVILFFVPWLDRSLVRSIRYRPDWHKYLYGAFVFFFLVLGYLGSQLDPRRCCSHRECMARRCG